MSPHHPIKRIPNERNVQSWSARRVSYAGASAHGSGCTTIVHVPFSRWYLSPLGLRYACSHARQPNSPAPAEPNCNTPSSSPVATRATGAKEEFSITSAPTGEETGETLTGHLYAFSRSRERRLRCCCVSVGGRCAGTCGWSSWPFALETLVRAGAGAGFAAGWSLGRSRARSSGARSGRTSGGRGGWTEKREGGRQIGSLGLGEGKVDPEECDAVSEEVASEKSCSKRSARGRRFPCVRIVEVYGEEKPKSVLVSVGGSGCG